MPSNGVVAAYAEMADILERFEAAIPDPERIEACIRDVRAGHVTAGLTLQDARRTVAFWSALLESYADLFDPDAREVLRESAASYRAAIDPAGLNQT